MLSATKSEGGDLEKDDDAFLFLQSYVFHSIWQDLKGCDLELTIAHDFLVFQLLSAL